MRQALSPRQPAGNESQKKLSFWVEVPGLCCQAAGGSPEWTDDITTAWLLFYSAAHIMDSVEDGDPPDPWWVDLGSGIAINTATGLYFCASSILNRLYLQDRTRNAAADVVAHFHNSFLSMCGGQHKDLIYQNRSLEQYWEIAREKSGVFFSVACYSSARIVTSDLSRLRAFESFGSHLGLLIQILDDLDELQHPPDDGLQAWAGNMVHSLPVVYALEVYPEVDRNRLRKVLHDLQAGIGSIGQVVDLIEASGATLYLATEMERNRTMALKALAQAASNDLAGTALADLIRAL